MSHVTCHISPFTCHMLYVKCLCWSFGQAEQLLFSCLCSKVSICNYVTCHILHVRCHIVHVTCNMSNAYDDHWDMLNNFCFHVYAQKWVFVIMSDVTCHIAYVTFHIAHATCHVSNAYVDPWVILNNFCFHVYAQKWVFVMSHFACHMSHVACHMSHVSCQMLMLILGTCWTIFVFMSMLKSEY